MVMYLFNVKDLVFFPFVDPPLSIRRINKKGKNKGIDTMAAVPRYIASARTAHKTPPPTVTPLLSVKEPLLNTGCFYGPTVLDLSKRATTLNLFTQDGFSFQDFQIFTERTSNVLNEL
jgi:hypothetical protein